MKKIIIFIILINLMAGGYQNNNPKQLTKNDLNITRNFEVLANKIINKKPKKLNISKIYQTIIQYSKLNLVWNFYLFRLTSFVKYLPIINKPANSTFPVPNTIKRNITNKIFVAS